MLGTSVRVNVLFSRMTLDLLRDEQTLAFSKLNIPPRSVCRDVSGTAEGRDITPVSSLCDAVFSLASDKYSDSP